MQLTRSRLRGRFDDERGVTIVLMALLLVIMLGMAALVVDFGLVRADRVRNKSAADVAVAAGLQAVNYNGYVGTFRGACAALGYLKANHSELSSLSLSSGWTDGSGTAISGGDPCDTTTAAYTARYNQTCNYTSDAAARPTFAWFSGTAAGGTITVTVKAGYSATDMTADGFSDETYHTDTGDASKYGCDQLAVSVQERETAGFGKAIGGSQLSSKIRSVGRVDIGTTADTAIGLLLLEQHDCAAGDLGSSTSQIAVLGSGTQAGLIHADSLGDGSDCSSKKVLNGQYTTPGMLAGHSPDSSKPGIVTTYAALGNATQQSNAVTATGTVVPQNTVPAASPAPTPYGRNRVGRISVDTKYRSAVASTRSEAQGYFDLSAAPAGWASTNCSPSAAVLSDTTSAGIWVNCTSFGPSGTTIFQNKNIVFTGNVKLGGSGNSIQFPNAEKVYVKGTAGGGGFGVSINSGASGSMKINTGASTDCDARRTAEPTKFARLVIGSGPLDLSSSSIKMCQTFVFLMDGDRIYNAGEVPSDNSYEGKVTVNGGGGLEWTAPNRYSTRPTAAEMVTSPFEDLALWTETSAHSSGNHSIAGGGTLKLKGVFFAPNANAFKFSGGGDGNISADAQFIVRKLFVTGGAHLTLTANPEDSVLTPSVDGYRLVR